MTSKKHSVFFKVANVWLVVLQTLGFFLMFLTPGFFGFLFGSAVGMITMQAFGDDAEAPFRFFTMISYGSLYVLFVFVHLKRTNSNDCVLQPTLTKIVIGYNALLAFAVIAAVVLHFIVEGAWFLLVVYASVPGFPILTACIGGDFEGALLMVRSFPVFALASPSFVGSLSAYSASRIADLSWGNRPCVLQPRSHAPRLYRPSPLPTWIPMHRQGFTTNGQGQAHCVA